MTQTLNQAEIKDRTVGQLVAERPTRARVFEQHGIDYCCGGKIALDAACSKKGIDLSTVIRELAENDAGPADSGFNPTAATLTELADHIETTHHAFLRGELPRLAQLAIKVARVHGPDNPKLVELAKEFAHFKGDMEAHTFKEEKVLFPLIRNLEAGHVALDSGYPHMPVRHPIAVMISEHEDAGASLAKMRALTDGFVPPAHACGSYRALLAGLEQLEQDTHRHVHKENEILFPRAIAAEA